MTFRFSPIETWPRPFTTRRRNSLFRSGYVSTVDLLVSELSHLRAKEPEIQLSMPRSVIRNDGLPKSDARTQGHPGVIVSFESQHGRLMFPCDSFFEWKDNLRGIALTLEHLRSAERYGVTKIGEQYQGWKALAAPAGTFRTLEEAADYISAGCGRRYSSAVILTAVALRDSAYRIAALKYHPDSGGSHEEFVRLQAAYEMLSKGETK